MDPTTEIFNDFIQTQHLYECQHEKMFTFQSASSCSKQSQINFNLGPQIAMVDMYQYQCWTSLLDHSTLVLRSKPLVDVGPSQWQFPEDLLDDTSVLAYQDYYWLL